MRDFVSMGVRGDKEFARKVRIAAKARGLKVGDYIRSLIIADNGSLVFFADDVHQNAQSTKTVNARKGK